MKIDWRSIEYKEYVSKALPQIVRTYFGDALEPQSSEGIIDFIYDDVPALTVYPRRELIGPEQFKRCGERDLKSRFGGLPSAEDKKEREERFDIPSE
jgi:hypothetical protein